MIDRTLNGFLDDPRFVGIVERDLREGRHRNPENVEGWFTAAYFHLPQEFRSEIEEAGPTWRPPEATPCIPLLSASSAKL